MKSFALTMLQRLVYVLHVEFTASVVSALTHMDRRDFAFYP